jgi:hypothetical protein
MEEPMMSRLKHSGILSKLKPNTAVEDDLPRYKATKNWSEKRRYLTKWSRTFKCILNNFGELAKSKSGESTQRPKEQV